MTVSRLSVCVFVVLSLCGVSRADFFSSTAQLNDLLQSDSVNSIVRAYIAKEEAKIAVLKRKLAILDHLRDSRNKDVPSSQHPVGVYHILSTFYDINETVNQQDHFAAYQTASKNAFPDMYDLLGAALGIIRLQTTFKLPAIDLIHGKIKGHQSHMLEPSEAFHIAQTAYDNQFYDAALDWMEAIYTTFWDRIAGNYRREVLLHSCYCYEKIPNIQKLRKTVKLLLHLYPNDKKVHDYYDNLDKSLSEVVNKFVASGRSDSERYAALCRGDYTKQRLPDHEAICRYKPVTGPYDIVKEEVLSYSPYVMFYYDVISDEESYFIRHLATEELRTSVVGNADETGKTTDSRVSKTAWLWDHDPRDFSKVTARVSKRISRITGLSHTTRETNSDAEATQVVNYGIGGQYEPHMDVSPLSDVKMGGSTVFPRAGLRVDAVKNGAVYWYSITPSGGYDWLTLHAGCPVLLGQKWIANKWFRSNGQIFRRPCGLEPTTSHRAITAASEVR